MQRGNVWDPFQDYTAGYFADGHVLYVKVSSERGVIAVTSVNVNNYAVDRLR